MLHDHPINSQRDKAIITAKEWQQPDGSRLTGSTSKLYINTCRTINQTIIIQICNRLFQKIKHLYKDNA